MTPPKGKPRSPGRTGGRWRKAQAACRAAAARGVPCAGCGLPVDVAIPYPHPQSFAADHTQELSDGGLPYRVQPMHKVCNEAKELSRRSMLRVSTLNVSREW